MRIPETHTLMDVVRVCENVLGWEPKGANVWKARAVEVAKLKRAQAKQPSLVTPENLRLAIAMSWRQRRPVDSPVALVPRIKDALAKAADPEQVSDITAQVQDAIAREQARGDDDSNYWIRRFVRSMGDARLATLTEWKEAGRA